MSGGEKKDVQELPKRFYKSVSVREVEGVGGAGLFLVLLDGRSLKTPGKKPIAVPGEAFAEALADEWRAQGERIDPATMPMTRIANSSIDGVSGREAEVAADIASFAGSDLTCYRAEGPHDLVGRQAAAWDPVLAWAWDSFGGRFVLAEGVMPVAQPTESIECFAGELSDLNAIQLGALHVMTTLTGSALIALYHAKGGLSAEAAWAAAHVDEDFQIAQWGEDEEASERRRNRWADFQAASRMFALLG